jgi:hypothetical protein
MCFEFLPGGSGGTVGLPTMYSFARSLVKALATAPWLSMVPARLSSRLQRLIILADQELPRGNLCFREE